MKKVLNIAFIVAIVMCGLGSCKKSTNGIATYYGVVMDGNTDAPFSGVDVKVTNGEKIHASAKTAEDGSFSVEVHLAEINKEYYIAIGNARMEIKKVEFPAFGNGSFNVGTIVVKGPTIPTIETKIASNITSKTAITGGNVTNNGGYAVTRRGVCWGDKQYPDISGNHTEDGTGNGEFMSSIGNLQPNTTYYIRAYAENEKGIAYGNQESFKSTSGAPMVTTTLVRVDNKTAVFCEGNITDEGDSPVTERGICWGTSTPTINNNKVTCGDGEGGFSTSITVTNVHSQNLYFRAYATNEHGTAYGETVMIDHRNPYNLFKITEGGVSYLVLPYDLDNAYMGEGSVYNEKAKQLCENLVAYDYNDWELPSITVLSLIYNNKSKIGGFANQYYWSSIYVTGGYYYSIDFASGTIYKSYNKYYGVRPVRLY